VPGAQSPEELAEIACEIETRRTGVDDLSTEEEAAIREGIADITAAS
jgi:hypothetical protein